jgi:hypothetical protein
VVAYVLPALLERFREDGADAEPVVIGARRPEAVVLSYERCLRLAGGRERAAAALDAQAREAGETLDADEALDIANTELHAMRRERRASADSGACSRSWTPRARLGGDLDGRSAAPDLGRLDRRALRATRKPGGDRRALRRARAAAVSPLDQHADRRRVHRRPAGVGGHHRRPARAGRADTRSRRRLPVRAHARDGADYLVSGDRHLTGLTDPHPPVLTPRQFLARLDER